MLCRRQGHSAATKNIPKTPPRFEVANFRFEIQCLNQLRHSEANWYNVYEAFGW